MNVTAVNYADVTQKFGGYFSYLPLEAVQDYIAAINAKKCQLFLLEHEEKDALLITSVSDHYGARVFNLLELGGTFGYATYPSEYLQIVKELAKAANCVELRATGNREGATKMYKAHGFTLKYSEYGIAI